MKNILIATIELSNSKDEVFALVDNNPLLITAIEGTKTGLVEKGVEIWDQKDNIIVTEAGYYCAFFEDQVKSFVG